MARPKSDNPKSYPVLVQLTASERILLEQRAVEGGESMSAYLRRCFLARPERAIVPEIHWERWKELSKTTANLNQLTHHCNGGNVVGGQEILPLVTALAAKVEKLRALLVGVDEG